MYLLLHGVPYVTAKRETSRGTLVTDLNVNDNKTLTPKDHQVWFTGEHPCKANGAPITALGGSVATQTLCDGAVVQRRFSNKPPEGFPDYHSKMTHYASILTNEARALDPDVKVCTFKVIHEAPGTSVFHYADSAGSRAGIAALSAKLAMDKIAIVGLGGTGSYVLDLLAKTHVKEIHLFDGDRFYQHNAFRAPGAASLEDLKSQRHKVQYYADTYSKMRTGIISHPSAIDDTNVAVLGAFSFVFVCVDRPQVRRLIADHLHSAKIPFIDCGMEVEHVEETQSLIGTCRCTLSTPKKQTHFYRHVTTNQSEADDLYRRNIQVVELNSLNAALAVLRWKKYCGYYSDFHGEHQSVYVIETHHLTRDETDELARLDADE